MDPACPIAGRVALLTAQSRLLADGRKQADQVGSLFGVQQRLHETFSSLSAPCTKRVARQHRDNHQDSLPVGSEPPDLRPESFAEHARCLWRRVWFVAGCWQVGRTCTWLMSVPPSWESGRPRLGLLVVYLARCAG
jgi:hypothetical protein